MANTSLNSKGIANRQETSLGVNIQVDPPGEKFYITLKGTTKGMLLHA